MKYVVIGSVVSTNDADRTVLSTKEMAIEHAKKLIARQGVFAKNKELWVVKVVSKVRPLEPVVPVEVIDEES